MSIIRNLKIPCEFKEKFNKSSKIKTQSRKSETSAVTGAENDAEKGTALI